MEFSLGDFKPMWVSGLFKNNCPFFCNDCKMLPCFELYFEQRFLSYGKYGSKIGGYFDPTSL